MDPWEKTMSSSQSFESVRSPAVASLFYPGNPLDLQQTIRELLDETSRDVDLPDDRILRALIVPHAGYVYSGSTAAKAYHLLKNYRDEFRRIILLGPAHRVWIEGSHFLELRPLKPLWVGFPSLSHRSGNYSVSRKCYSVTMPIWKSTALKYNSLFSRNCWESSI